MIKIIAKGYKYLLTQIDDFLGSVRTIVISLKSIKGRKEYEKLFGRKLDDQKTNIKIRIISLKQSRLTDFISNLFEKSRFCCKNNFTALLGYNDCFLYHY